jgi:superfamily II DNA/RNA helicase
MLTGSAMMAGQIVEVIDPAARDRRLDELLRKYHGSRKNRVLVFVLYKKEAARVEAMLQKKGWKVAPPFPSMLTQTVLVLAPANCP